MDCHLLIPSLFPPRPQTRGNDPLDQAGAPALQLLLARGRRVLSAAADMETWLCARFGIERGPDYPLASLRLAAEGIDPGTAYWLCADPVHLAVERDQLVLTQVPLRPHEASGLIETLNAHFTGDGLHFIAPHPERWYLRLDHTPAITTRHLTEAVGRDIHPLLPAGPEALRWRSLLNEIQMVLFDHPVNALREAQGEPPINSIWPWGGGVRPHGMQRPFDQIWSDSPLARGAGLAAAIHGAPLAANADEWLASATPGRHLIVLDQLQTPASHGNQHDWRAHLTVLEREWFVPLKRAIARGKITLVLHAPGPVATLEIVTSRPDLWKFWLPPRALRHYRPEI